VQQPRHPQQPVQQYSIQIQQPSQQLGQLQQPVHQQAVQQQVAAPVPPAPRVPLAVQQVTQGQGGEHIFPVLY